MAWGVRGSSSNTNSTSTCAVIMASGKHQIGDLMWVGIGVRNSATATVSSVVDDRGNTYTFHRRYAAAGQFVEQWTAPVGDNAQTTITVTFSGAVNSTVITAGFSGAPATWSVVTGNDGSAASATSHPCGSCSAQSGDLMVTMSSLLGSFNATANADYTQLVLESRAYSQWKEPTGAYTSSATWTSVAAEDTTSNHIVIRDAAGGGGGAKPWLYRSHTQTLGAGFQRGAL